MGFLPFGYHPYWFAGVGTGKTAGGAAVIQIVWRGVDRAVPVLVALLLFACGAETQPGPRKPPKAIVMISLDT